MNLKAMGVAVVLAIGFASEAAFADGSAATAAPSVSEFTITGTAAILSNYKFRGLTESDNRPAVQASIKVTDASGFYLGVWGSSGAGYRNDSMSFYNSTNNGSEIRVYGGYAHKLASSDLTLDGGLIGYIFPNEPFSNLFEVYGDVSKAYGPVTAKIGVNWAPKQPYFCPLCELPRYNLYEFGELSYSPLRAPAYVLHGHLGHTGGGLDYFRAYVDYNVGIGYRWKSLTFDVSAVGTSLSHRQATAIFNVPLTSYDINSFWRVSKLGPVASIAVSF